MARSCSQTAFRPPLRVRSRPTTCRRGRQWGGTGRAPNIGANIGAVFHRGSVADAPSTSLPILTTTNSNPANSGGSGVIGGLEAAYNWQMANLVLGVEADISGSSLDHTKSWFPYPGDTDNTTLKWLSTVRGRVGWAFGRTLVYETDGIAFASLKDKLAPITATSTNVTGWAAGAGIEYALPDHWTAKATLDWHQPYARERPLSGLLTLGSGLN